MIRSCHAEKPELAPGNFASTSCLGTLRAQSKRSTAWCMIYVEARNHRLPELRLVGDRRVAQLVKHFSPALDMSFGLVLRYAVDFPS